MKEKLTKYFVSADTVKWYDIIDNIVDNYNRTVNRGIGIEPIKVNPFIENEIVQEKKAQTGIIKPTVPEFVVGDKVIILRNKDVLFQDKMKAAYSTKIYTVTGTTANSLELTDADGNEKKVKKSQARKIINVNDFVVVNAHIENAIDQANREDKQRRELKKSGVDANNIIEGKRVRKPNSRFV